MNPDDPRALYKVDPAAIGKLVLGVPGAPRAPRGNLSRSMIWIYGDPKIGKTTFASDAPGTWFIATEQGQDWVMVREPTVVHSWEQWNQFCDYIERDKPTAFADGAPIETFAIDRLEGLFRMCEDYVRKSLGVESLDELGHGKGWARLTSEWERSMNRVRRWPFGMIAISHVRTKEFKKRSGAKVDRYEPDIGAAGMRWALGAADLILYAHAVSSAEVNAKGQPTGNTIEERLVQCHPSSSAVAGGRMAQLLPSLCALDYNTIRTLIENPQEVPQ